MRIQRLRQLGTELHAIEEWLELGARFICHGADISFIKRGLEQTREECAKLGFTFDDPIGNRVAIR